jgi:hypothetical protein
MPGLVRDPVNNSKEGRFGFLLDYEDGHIKPYLKEDESSRYFPANTPVDFELAEAKIHINGQGSPYTMEVAVNVKYNPGILKSDQPMVEKYIELGKEKLGKYKKNRYKPYNETEKTDIKNKNVVI